VKHAAKKIASYFSGIELSEFLTCLAILGLGQNRNLRRFRFTPQPLVKNVLFVGSDTIP
jgi:hypothetical protein